jgi:hypothetical protein
MSTVSVLSIEAFLAAVEAAEQRLVSGEAKARQAKALLLQAEKARDEAAARKAEAEQQLAPIEKALNKARALRALVGEEVISQGEALLERTWAETQTEVTRLQAEAEAAQAEVERLMSTPEVKAYLDYREAQECVHREARQRERSELEVRLAALRPGAAVGQGIEPLTKLTAQARKAGFPNLAAQAQDAAEAARQVAQAQAQAERALRKRRLIRWAERRSAQAQPGDFVFVVRRSDEDNDEMGALLHLRPLPSRSGRLRFQVVAALGVENPPDEYSDVPSRGRAWRWRNPPTGEPEGLAEAQAGMVTQIIRGKLRSGWSINRANVRLAARPVRQVAQDGEDEVSHESQVVVGAEIITKSASAHPAEDLASGESTQPARCESAGPKEPESTCAEGETRPPQAPVVDGLVGFPLQVATRLQRVGLNTRCAVEDTLTAGDDVFLALPGIGPATLRAVKEWLDPPVQTDHAEAKVEEWPQAVPETDEEPSEAEQDETVAAVSEPGEVPCARADRPVEQASGEPQPAPSRGSQAALEAISEAPLVASAVCEDAQEACQPQPQTPEPTITVEGDGVGGQHLAQWQGVARVGLTPVAQRLGFEEVQVLVHEDEGQSTLVAYWPGGEATLFCPVDGRVGQMRAVRELVQQIKAAA